MLKKVKIIATIGPNSNSPEILGAFKERGVDFIRINLSHTNIEDIEEKVKILKNHSNIPIILDTEGPQVRTGNESEIEFIEGDTVKLYNRAVDCDAKNVYLTPEHIVNSFKKGDKISLAFGSALLTVSDTSLRRVHGYLECNVLQGGVFGGRKAVHIESPNFDLPDFSKKDLEAFEIAKKYGVKHFTLSFMEHPESVDKVRKIVAGSVLYSKIESQEGVRRFDEIADRSNGILIDRGDLSSEVPIELIPFIQKDLTKRAREKGIEAFVATDTLQNMFSSLRPNAADANDIANTLLDGITGIALTKETAVGKYPIQTVDMLRSIINTYESYMADNLLPRNHFKDKSYL